MSASVSTIHSTIRGSGMTGGTGPRDTHTGDTRMAAGDIRTGTMRGMTGTIMMDTTMAGMTAIMAEVEVGAVRC